MDDFFSFAFKQINWMQVVMWSFVAIIHPNMTLCVLSRWSQDKEETSPKVSHQTR